MMINLLWLGVKCRTVKCFSPKKDFISGNLNRKSRLYLELNLKFQLSTARQYCNANGGTLWYPSYPMVTGHIVDHDETQNRSFSDNLQQIFDLFEKNSEMQDKTHLELAWTSIQRRVQQILTLLFNSLLYM